jgi:hypothetical protein
MERVERIEDLDLGAFRAQGIVVVDAIIRTFIASSLQVACPSTGRGGSPHRHVSCCPSVF